MRQSDIVNLALEPRLTQKNAANLAATLAGHRYRPINLDASAVIHVGAPGFEVLLAAMRGWMEKSVEFTFTDPSESFMDDLARIGLVAEEFGLNEG
ncbi:MAG: hypothetical protein GXP03_15470 [Alphaproteobacteria bacterium]|nr:hypothetical protein [Alphaproteobacteria bacterium]